MFKTGNSSGSSGNSGGGRKISQLFAGKFRLPHRSGTGTKRRNQHVNYEYSFLNRLWSKMTGKAPRIPGTVRGKKRWANTYFPQKMPTARHGGRRKGLPSVKMVTGGGMPLHTGKRRRLGREFSGLSVPMAEHSGKKRRLKSGFTGATVAYDSHGGRKRKKNLGTTMDLFTSSSYRGGKGKEIAGVRPVVFFQTGYSGGKRRQNPVGAYFPELSHRGGKRWKNSMDFGTALFGLSHRGRSRRMSSAGWGGVVSTSHRGSRRKENRSLVVASGKAYSGSRKLFSFGKSYTVPKALGGTHRGSRWSHHRSRVYGVPQAFYRGGGHQRHRNAFEFGIPHVHHRGGKQGRHGGSGFVPLSRNWYRGGGHQRHRNAFEFGIPHVHHRGGKQGRHGGSGFVPMSHDLYRGGGHQRHRNAFEFGIPHVHHRGSRKSRHSSGGFGFAFGDSYGGQKGRKRSSSFLPPEVSAPYGGNRKNGHQGFVGYHSPAVYRSGGLLDMVFGAESRHESFVPQGHLRRYKVSRKRRRETFVVSGYRSSLARQKYRPKKRDIAVHVGGGKSATARRRGEMAYLRKISRRKRIKSNDMGMYQGHVSLNQFLRGVILVLSILVAITLFILASTFDSWWDFGEEFSESQVEVSTISTNCVKKSVNPLKEL